MRDSWGKRFDAYVSNNILATQWLLEAAKGQSLKKFVFASTSSVYGNTGLLPTTEDHIPRPYSPYGVTKLAAEHLCLLYHQNYGVPTVALRYFTVYGPRQRPDMAISRFIGCMLDEKPITVYGDGKQKRDFSYVGDIIRANILAAEADVAGDVFNVGSGKPVALMEVIGILEELSEGRPGWSFCQAKGGRKGYLGGYKKISTILRFVPSTGLRTGLKEQLEYMKNEKVLIRKSHYVPPE